MSQNYPSEHLSLCMIVRDEADMLPQFLKAAEGLWDDLCVVDTGSTDATVEILQAAGARIFQHPWSHDFAEARNVSLENALGEWIIVLDADEMISKEAIASARALLGKKDVGAATVEITHEMQFGHQSTSFLLRMFRNDPSIRFSYAIHEDAGHSAIAYLMRTGKSIERLEGNVIHLGYDKERALKTNKKDRDMHILRQCVQQDPTDLYSWFKMLELARFWQDNAALQEHAQAVLPWLGSATNELLQQAHYIGEMLTLVAQGLYPEDNQASLDFLTGWEERVKPSAAYYLRRGELHELLGHINDAEADFLQAMGLRNQTSNAQLAQTRPLLGIARISLIKQDLPTALEYIDRALLNNPRDPEALLAIVGLCQQIGGSDAVKTMVEAYLEAHGETAELHLALGELGMQLVETPDTPQLNP